MWNLDKFVSTYNFLIYINFSKFLKTYNLYYFTFKFVRSPQQAMHKVKTKVTMHIQGLTSKDAIAIIKWLA